MKQKWWMIVLAVVLIAAVLTFVFWDAIVIRVAPKLVLSEALGNTIAALESRFSDNPIHVLSEALDADFRNTVQLRLDTRNDLLGDISYDMTVQTQGSPQKILAEGMVTTGGRRMDLSLYMDSTFAAVSSDDLVQGNYYGITYDTFSKDIRGNTVLAFLIGDEIIQQWETSVAGLQAQMSRAYQLPRVSAEDMQSVLVGILALKSHVDTGTLAIRGQERDVYQVSFSATGPEIATAAEDYLSQLSSQLQELVAALKNDPDSTLRASFFLWEDSLVKIEGILSTSGRTFRVTLDPGADPAKDELSLEVVSQAGEEVKRYAVAVNTTHDEVRYAETLELRQVINGTQDRTVLDYDWDLTSGDMQLNLTEGSQDASIRLNLQQTQNGFRVSTDQFETLMGMLTGAQKEGSSTCTMTVTRGSSFETPAYRNFDQWSMDDLFVLLGGLGGLFGLQTG